MPTPVVTLGGVYLGGHQTYDWTLKYGTQPHVALWTVAREVAEALRPFLGLPQELRIKGPRRELLYRNLYPLEIYPGNDPRTRKVLVKDLRWKWPYAWLWAQFNVPRMTGESIIVSDAGEPAERVVTDPKLIYEPTTLYPFGDSPSAPWTAKQVIDFLLRSSGPDGLGESVQLDFDDPGVPVQDFRIDDSGANAIERALRYLSGVDVYVSASGSVVVTDTRSKSGDEIAARTKRGRLTTGPESLIVRRTAVRPREIVHLITPEPEILLQFSEDEVTVTRFDRLDQPQLRNVVRNPDESVTIDGNSVARGSYIVMDDILGCSEWSAFGINNEAITLKALRERILENGGTRIENQFSYDGNGSFDAQWAGRVQAVVSAWRKLYRVAPTFFGRLASIAPVRAAILNTETGTRAASPVYSDYVRLPTERGVFKAPGVVQRMWTVEGYDGGFAIGSDSVVAPAALRVADAGVGVLEVVPLRNPLGLYGELFFGYPTGSIPEIAGLSAANREADLAKAIVAYANLRAGYFMATIVSVTPATPQNRNRFLQIRKPVPGGTGPVLYSRIFPGVITARYKHKDSSVESVVACIKGEQDWASLQHLLVNGAQVEAVTDANQRRILDGFRDRTYGQHDIDMDPSIEPTGCLAEVRQVMSSGATVTKLRFPEDARPLDLWRFLDASQRRALLKTLLTPVQGSSAP